MKKFKTEIWAMLLTTGIIGCAAGPNYKRPEAAVPPSFQEAKKEIISGEVSQLARWWTTFNDRVLNSLIEKAIHSNIDLRVAEIHIKEVRASRGIIDSDRWPQVNASGSYAQNRVSENTRQGRSVKAFGGAEYELYQTGFDASWEIDLFGSVRRAVEAADADIESAIESRRSVLVTLLGDVARNYIELRGLQRQIIITKGNLKIQEETLKLIQARYKAGLISYLDVTRAEAQVADTDAQIPLLERSLKQVSHRLSVLSGQEPGSLWAELSRDAPIPVPPSQVVVGIPSELLRRRPDLRRTEREIAAASARIGVATADLFPRFSLTGSFGLQGQSSNDLSDSASRFWSAGPSIHLPIFTAGLIRSNIKVQDARYEQALARYEQTVLTALEDVENSLVAWFMEQSRLKSLSEATTANRQSAAMARELYSKGLTDFLNVLEAERSLLSSENQLAQSEAAVSTNLVALYKALGGGWE
ncbi:MAG: efflux transporter outer membrane subunit [Nitrospinota bacterium]